MVIINKKTQKWFLKPNKQKLLMAISACFIVTSCGQSSLPSLIPMGKKAKEREMEKMQDTVSRMEPVPVKTIQAQNSVNKNLFGSSLRSDDERLSRLERAVQELRNDFDTVSPSIKRLMAIEADIQDLIGELRKLSTEPSRSFGSNNTGKPPEIIRTKQAPVKKATSSKKTYQTKSAPPVQNGMATVYDLRTGQHPGKTRLVMDTNTKTNFSVDIDNSENIMVIDMPNTNWTASMSGTVAKSSVIQSYNVEKNGDGVLFIAQLKRNARIAYKDDLPSNSGSGRRIVIDVAPQ